MAPEALKRGISVEAKRIISDVLPVGERCELPLSLHPARTHDSRNLIEVSSGVLIGSRAYQYANDACVVDESGEPIYKCKADVVTATYADCPSGRNGVIVVLQVLYNQLCKVGEDASCRAIPPLGRLISLRSSDPSFGKLLFEEKLRIVLRIDEKNRAQDTLLTKIIGNLLALNAEGTRPLFLTRAECWRPFLDPNLNGVKLRTRINTLSSTTSVSCKEYKNTLLEDGEKEAVKKDPRLGRYLGMLRTVPQYSEKSYLELVNILIRANPDNILVFSNSSKRKVPAVNVTPKHRDKPKEKVIASSKISNVPNKGRNNNDTRPVTFGNKEQKKEGEEKIVITIPRRDTTRVIPPFPETAPVELSVTPSEIYWFCVGVGGLDKEVFEKIGWGYLEVFEKSRILLLSILSGFKDKKDLATAESAMASLMPKLVSSHRDKFSNFLKNNAQVEAIHIGSFLCGFRYEDGYNAFLKNVYKEAILRSSRVVASVS